MAAKLVVRMEVMHSGNDDKLPELVVYYEVPDKTETLMYHRADEGLWRTQTGWPAGREFGAVFELLYKQFLRQEFSNAG